MHAQETFRINDPQVVAEVIGGEAIIVNLDSGAYFSLRGSARLIWESLLGGATPAATVDALLATHTGERATVETALHDFLAQLLDEGLLVRDARDPANRGMQPAVERPSADTLPFEAPVLEKYTDMADLLLLDPIHEVEEQGWPRAAVAADG